MIKHLKRFVAITISLVMAFQFSTNDLYTYAQTEDVVEPTQTEVSTESDSTATEQPVEPSETVEGAADTTTPPETGTDTTEPAPDTGTTPETQPAEPQQEVAGTLKVEFVDASNATVKESVVQALTSKYVGDTIRLEDLSIETNIEGYTLTEVKDKNDNTQVYTTETKDFVLTGNVTELQFVYTQNVQTDQPEESEDSNAQQGGQEDSNSTQEQEETDDEESVSLKINYVTRNKLLEKEPIEEKESIQIQGEKGEVIQLDQYKVDIDGYTLSSETEALTEITLANDNSSVDLVYEKIEQFRATAMLAYEDPATYNITYASNYPDRAMKFDSKNGTSQTELVEAAQTNAVYTYTSGALATVVEGFSLANSNFVSWNTKADGSGKTYNPGDEIEVTENVVLYAQWTNPSEVKKMDLEVRYYNQRKMIILP